MNFGRELKAQRALAGLSQRQAAEAIPYLSVRTLQAWEYGHQSPPVWAQNLILEKLSKVKKRIARRRNS
jgi:DNA-binding transcriptional regulator YiaG